ncbi:hypothetical protein ILUMI_06056 [Ignelater luminosus]|uniref:Arrestin C-terminal-like domain-containing protein n=1 Tax=Ignelater luminosus TaxID=2038154 RepID=A0A8K0DBF8_IGNLU|nr:hypothetical protein ILUMI_06056 [Ignelater luminosus]
MQSSVKIVLNDNPSAFCPGQTVTGRVECMFASEKTIRAIRIKFRGAAKTRWSVKIGKHHMAFWAEEIYFDQEYTLVEADRDDHVRLSAGIHAYPFSYTLPQALPTSCNQIHGKIKYKIKVIVDRPLKTNFKDKLHLHIMPSLDLNILRNVQEPFSYSVQESITPSCLCFKSDFVTFAIFLPVTGYAAGQEINVGCYVQNMTNVNVKRVQYKVIRAFEFISHHPHERSKLSENTIASCKTDAIGAHSEKSWTSTLVVPLDLVLNFFNCSIIDVEYRLEVKVIMPFPHADLKITCPIILGTVPLLGLDTNMLGPPRQPDTIPTAPSVEEDIPGSSHTTIHVEEVRKL